MNINKTNSGFTLIEVLVVISIISVLAAILFPVFSQAKAAAKGTVCINNLHQIGLGTLGYCTDDDDFLPYAPSSYSKAISVNALKVGETLTLFERKVVHLRDIKSLLNPYSVSESNWICPVDRMDANLLSENGFGILHLSTWYLEDGSSYDYDDVSAIKGQSLSGYEKASESIIYLDQGGFHSISPSTGVGNKNLEFADMHIHIDNKNNWYTEFAPAGDIYSR